MPRREKISAVDTAWLRMDRPGNPMMICGVFLLRSRVPLARLRRTIDERFLCFGRFRQRPVQEAGTAFWEDDGTFDIRRHVVETTLPEPAGQVELQRLVSTLAGTPLDPDRPLWEFHARAQLSARQCAGRAHAPLLRRRDRADPGRAVDDRCGPQRFARAPAATTPRVARRSER